LAELSLVDFNSPLIVIYAVPEICAEAIYFFLLIKV
jgi:hypothetical protein